MSAACSQVLAMLLPSPTQATTLPVDRAAVLDEGEDVGQDLARVVFVGQAVDHRHARVARRRRSSLVCSKVRIITRSTMRLITRAAVLDRLGAAELAVAGGQVHDRAAHLVHAGLEADARARAGLLEDHRQRAVDQRLVLLVVLEALLDDRGALEQVGVLLGAEVLELQVVLDAGSCRASCRARRSREELLDQRHQDGDDLRRPRRG